MPDRTFDETFIRFCHWVINYKIKSITDLMIRSDLIGNKGTTMMKPDLTLADVDTLRSAALSKRVVLVIFLVFLLLTPLSSSL